MYISLVNQLYELIYWITFLAKCNESNFIRNQLEDNSITFSRVFFQSLLLFGMLSFKATNYHYYIYYMGGWSYDILFVGAIVWCDTRGHNKQPSLNTDAEEAGRKRKKKRKKKTEASNK